MFVLFYILTIKETGREGGGKEDTIEIFLVMMKLLIVVIMNGERIEF